MLKFIYANIIVILTNYRVLVTLLDTKHIYSCTSYRFKEQINVCSYNIQFNNLC